MITLNAIAKRLEEFATNHFFIKSYSFGSPDDVDLDKFEDFPLMHVVYTGATYDERLKAYSFEVYIFDRPNREEQMTLNQRELVSDSEQCLEDIVADVSNGGYIFLFDEDYNVTAANVSPLIDERSNLLAGSLLDLTIEVPYQRDACNLPINGVTPEGGEIVYARRGILRVRTQDGSVDVQSVNEIRVTNGTLTDEGGGAVSLSITGSGAVDSVNGQTGVVVLDTDDISEGSNLYYTDARVDARVTALDLATETYVDTAVGVEEAARITADGTLQTQITTNAGDIAALEAADYVNTLNGVDGAVTIAAGSNVTVATVGQTITISSSGGGGGGGNKFDDIDGVTADSGSSSVDFVEGANVTITSDNTAKTITFAVSGLDTDDVTEAGNLYYTEARVSANASVVANTAKNSYPTADASKLAGIEAGAEVNPTAAETKTAYESNADTNAFTDAEQTKLAGIATGAEVNVNADWDATSGDAEILNKPTLAAVATSGAYGDLSGTPTIPAQFFNVVSDAATSITLDTGDEGRYIRCTASSAVTVTVPSGKFQADDEIIIEQAGTGQVEIAAGGGVTINNSSANTKKTAEQFAVIALKCTATDVFTLTGERELV